MMWLQDEFWGVLDHTSSSTSCEMDKDPKPTAKAHQDFLKAKKLNMLQWPSQLLHLNTIEQFCIHWSQLLRLERRTNKQQTKVSVAKTWQSISIKETHEGPWAPDFRQPLTTKGFHPNIKNYYLFTNIFSLSKCLLAPENRGTVFEMALILKW